MFFLFFSREDTCLLKFFLYFWHASLSTVWSIILWCRNACNFLPLFAKDITTLTHCTLWSIILTARDTCNFLPLSLTRGAHVGRQLTSLHREELKNIIYPRTHERNENTSDSFGCRNGKLTLLSTYSYFYIFFLFTQSYFTNNDWFNWTMCQLQF